ncbi:hypothetical protein KCV05_g190, partial [Aureobasidium melanogenum]
LLPDYLEHQCSSSRGANRVTNLSADNSATRKACIFQNAHVLCQEDRIVCSTVTVVWLTGVLEYYMPPDTLDRLFWWARQRYSKHTAHRLSGQENGVPSNVRWMVQNRGRRYTTCDARARTTESSSRSED